MVSAFAKRRFRHIAIVVICLATSPLVGAQKAEYRIAPAPAWVTPVALEPGSDMKLSGSDNGTQFLLVDTQTRVEATDQQVYRRLVSKAQNERGVESIANISLRFNPAYQTIVLHAIRIIRGSRTIEKLPSAAVKVLQREANLENRIYDGAKSLNVFLDDVRVGDSVEYAYTLRDTNPLFLKQRFGQFDLQWRVPVYKVHARLLWPAGRPVQILARNTKQTPAVKDLRGFQEYVWEATQRPGVALDPDAPGWFDPYASVQWSEFKDWEAVAAWALPLYRIAEAENSPVLAEARRIAAAHGSPEARLAAVLNFVQSEVRYLGIEIGTSSHRPTDPAQVLARRFGDCKDKSLLMIAMLRAIGIEAYPALVHTRLKRAIADYQATPGAFNHAIVHARIGEKDYWLDPTRDPQKGALAHLFQPDFGFALVVAPQVTALKSMTSGLRPAYKKTIAAVFDSREGTQNPVRYTVTTVHEAASADYMRGELASESREELQKNYLNFYARYFPQIEVAEPMKIEDDGEGNRVSVTEQYWVKSFWKRNEGKGRLESFIVAPDVDSLLKAPDRTIRTSPLHVEHPKEISQVTEVLLPRKWNIDPSQRTVADKVFRFEQQVEVDDKRFVIRNSFRTLADHVPAAEVARYAENMKKADKQSGYWLYSRDKGAGDAPLQFDRLLYLVIALALFAVAATIWITLRITRDRQRADGAG